MAISGRSSRVMSRVAALSVAVSIAVMIISLGVVAGFRTTISDNIAGMSADITISAPQSVSDQGESFMLHDSLLTAQITEQSHATHLQRHASKAAIMRGDSAMLGIVLKGVGSDYNHDFLQKHLKRGYIPTYNDTLRSRKAVVSATIARTMGLDTTSRFELLFVGNGAAPRRERLEVAGIYSSGMEEFDKSMIIGDIAIVQRINNWSPQQISGYEVSLAPGADAELQAELIDEIIYDRNAEQGITSLIDQPDVATMYQSYSQLFDWLEMLGLNTTIIIVIMTIVAAINMICGVLIIVLEQTRTIGILKALGTPDRSLQTIFILRSARITLRGMLWGNIVGLALCYAQSQWGLLALDSESYMVATVPMQVDLLAVLALNLGSFLVITLAMTIPTMIISRITPSQSIRFS